MSIVGIIIWLLCGYACYVLAGKRGFNQIIALILGLIFGLLALVVYGILYLVKK